MIKIITDSTAYIPEKLLNEYGIQVLPMAVNMDGQRYLETDITNYSFFQKMNESSEIPTSSPPSVETITEMFEEHVKEGKSVIGIFVAAYGSDTVKRANQAKDALQKKYPKANITIIDSKNTAMGLGVIVLAAAEAYREGAWLEDVVDAAHGAILRNRFLFIPKNLDYMAKSGRIGKARALMGNLMQMIPLLTAIKGEISPLEMVRTYDKAIDRMVEIMKEDMNKFGLKKVIVTHIDSPETAEKLRQKVAPLIDGEILISEIGPVVGLTVGPGTIGLIYNTIDVHPLNE